MSDGDRFESRKELSREERYWEHAFRENASALERYNSQIRHLRQSTLTLTRYHMLFIGLAGAVVGISDPSLRFIPPSIGGVIVLSSIIGIGSSVFAVAQYPSVYGSVTPEGFAQIHEESESYEDAMYQLSTEYSGVREQYNSRLDTIRKLRTITYAALMASTGCLTISVARFVFF